MPNTNLFTDLQVSQLEQDEFEQILSDEFNTAQEVSPTEIVYPSDPVQFAVRVRYGKDGRIAAMDAGPTFTDANLASLKRRIHDDLLTTSGTMIARLVLFASVPTTGFCRYKEHFQLMPVPAHAPRPSVIIGDHPLLLEFSFPATTNAMLRFRRRAVQERILTLLFHAFLPYGMHSLGNNANFHWVHEPGSGLSLKSIWCQSMYEYEGLKREDTSFGDTTSTPSLATVEPQAYYNRRGIGSGDVVELPAIFASLMDKFYGLSAADRERFLRSCFWFQSADATWASSKSATFVALISAIEVLDDSTEAGPACPTCKRSTGPGPTKRFVDFVDKYAPGIPEADRRRLYGVRSALSHGGRLLHSDRTAWHAFTPERLKEWSDLRTAQGIVRSCLVNWLSSSL